MTHAVTKSSSRDSVNIPDPKEQEREWLPELRKTELWVAGHLVLSNHILCKDKTRLRQLARRQKIDCPYTTHRHPSNPLPGLQPKAEGMACRPYKSACWMVPVLDHPDKDSQTIRVMSWLLNPSNSNTAALDFAWCLWHSLFNGVTFSAEVTFQMWSGDHLIRNHLKPL